MDKFKRNIQQLERKNIDTRFYFLDKAIEEAKEWIEAIEKYKDCLKHDRAEGTTFEENLELETADVMNCSIYLSELKLIDMDRTQEYADLKQDIAYEKEAGDLHTLCKKCGRKCLQHKEQIICRNCDLKDYLKYLKEDNKRRKGECK